MPIWMDPAEFEDQVAHALDQIPESLAEVMDNCAILVRDNPPPGAHLLGLYEGIPLTERGSRYAGVLPDRILIFRNPILAMCDSVDEVVRQVRITVMHEIAHHFGIDDQRLSELGYG